VRALALHQPSAHVASAAGTDLNNGLRRVERRPRLAFRASWPATSTAGPGNHSDPSPNPARGTYWRGLLVTVGQFFRGSRPTPR
jgi:hypothetical protein